MALWPVCSSRPSICKTFWRVDWKFILGVLVFPLFVHSDSSGFCFNVSVNCAVSLVFDTLYFWRIILFFPFQQILISRFPVDCLCSLILQKSFCLLFLLLLVDIYRFCVNCSCCVYQFISVMSDSFSFKVSHWSQPSAFISLLLQCW